MTCGVQLERAIQRVQLPVGRRSRQRGSSLVEQSFIIVFLLTMMFGIIDCGRALYTYHFVSNVAREATRWASVRSRSCNASAVPPGPATNSNVQSTFTTNLTTMGLDPSNITFTTTWVVPPGVAATSCPGANQNVAGCMVHIDVRYSYTFLFAPFISAPPISMTSSSEMLITQ
jgi:Flp pilus assembly protein TadG